jgi:hypothetical protein
LEPPALAPRTEPRTGHPAGWLALAAVIAATVWRFWNTSGTPDVAIWLGWMETFLAEGPRRGYEAIAADYPPGAPLLLWMAGHAGAAVGADPRVAIKALVLLFLAATTAVTFAATRQPSAAAFAHAALATSALGLVYLDILFAPFVLAAIWAGRSGRPALMSNLLLAGCLMKWQPLLIAPFAAVHIIKQRAALPRREWQATRRSAVLTAAIAIGVLIALFGLPVIDSLYRASRHGTLSSFGANLPWLLTWWLERTSADRAAAGGIISIVDASRPALRVLSAVTLVAYAAVLRAYWRSTDPTVAGWVRHALAGYLVYFMCSAGVHENHLFLASLLGIALWMLDGRWLWVAAATTVSANLNLVTFYGWGGYVERRMLAGVDASVWLALANVGLFAVAGARLLSDRSTAAR